jgi:hypothetical protein
MSVTIPTATSIKMRFPEFAEIDDSVIEFAIEEARLEVGDNWLEATASIALAYLVAHYVAASRDRVDEAAGSSGDVASESFGRFSITYAKNSASTASSTDKESSPYGLRYLEILGANFSGPVIV